MENESKKIVYCKFCGKYVTDVCYLIEPSATAISDLKDSLRTKLKTGTTKSKSLGCDIIVDDNNITFQDTILEKAMKNYGMNATLAMPDGTEEPIVKKHIRFAVTVNKDTPIDSYVSDFLKVTEKISGVGKLSSQECSCIDGQYLIYGNNPAGHLCCGSCHMRLETHQVHSTQIENQTYYVSEESTDKNINIMFFGTRSSGKTVLLLALLHQLIENDTNAKESFEKLNDDYVSTYYETLEEYLFLSEILPPTTQTISQPPITLQLGDYHVSMIDTMGDIMDNQKHEQKEYIEHKIDPIEILNHSDAIVVIHSISTKLNQDTQNRGEIDIADTIKQLGKAKRFIDELLRATMGKAKKHTMLLFNKCDISPREVAEEMMLEKECPNPSPNDAQQIQLLRKVFFSRNSDIVIEKICRFLTAGDLTKKERLKEASKRLYQNCKVISNDRVRIQCISPLGGPEPNYQNSPMYVSDFINMLIELCEEISNG